MCSRALTRVHGEKARCVGVWMHAQRRVYVPHRAAWSCAVVYTAGARTGRHPQNRHPHVSQVNISPSYHPFFFLTAQQHMQEAGGTVAEMCESGQRAIRELDQAQRWLDDAASSSASELDDIEKQVPVDAAHTTSRSPPRALKGMRKRSPSSSSSSSSPFTCSSRALAGMRKRVGMYAHTCTTHTNMYNHTHTHTLSLSHLHKFTRAHNETCELHLI